MNKRNLGILLMLLSAFSFACMQIVVKLSSGTIPLMEQVFVRNIISLSVAFFLIKKSKVSVFGEKKYQPSLFARSFFGFIGVIFLFYASSHANQADVTILNKMSPFLITIFATMFLGEKLSKMQIPALLIAFGGAFLVANPKFNSNMFPLIMAFLSAVASGVAYTLLSYFKNKVNGLTVIMHFSTFSMVASVPFIIGNFVVPTGSDLITLILIGVFGSLGQIALTYSYRLVPASEVSIYNYSGILFSMILGYVVLNQKVGINSLIGGSIVVLASFMVYWYNNNKRENENDEGTKKFA